MIEWQAPAPSNRASFRGPEFTCPTPASPTIFTIILIEKWHTERGKALLVERESVIWILNLTMTSGVIGKQ